MSELPIKVKVQESASQVVYTDAVLINGNPLGFVLNFGQWAPEEPGLVRVYTRVGMSPNHLKLLAQLLTQNVAAYEARFGEMVVTEDRAAQAHRIGFDVGPAAANRAGFLGSGRARKVIDLTKRVGSVHVQFEKLAIVQIRDPGRRRRDELAYNGMRHSEAD